MNLAKGRWVKQIPGGDGVAGEPGEGEMMGEADEDGV